jgi:hypothetical protein
LPRSLPPLRGVFSLTSINKDVTPPKGGPGQSQEGPRGGGGGPQGGLSFKLGTGGSHPAIILIGIY